MGKMSNIKEAGYRLDLTFQKDGRTKILIENVGIDRIDSGQVTVKPERHVFVVDGTPNPETKVTIQYEESNTYYGEKED